MQKLFYEFIKYVDCSVLEGHRGKERQNKLYDEGNTIVYWTARGSRKQIDWRELTEKQLKEWGAKYHELEVDKPFYDLFIEDKSCRIEEL